MRLSQELRQRTKAFGAEVIRAYIKLPKIREEVRILGRQFLRAGTSVPAHAREASRARSDAEFCSKLDGLLQEADEVQLWAEYLIEECHLDMDILQAIHKESGELLAIFVSMVARVRKGLN